MTTDDTTTRPAPTSSLSVFERCDLITGIDENRIRASFDGADVWDAYEAAFIRDEPGAQRAAMLLHRMLIFLEKRDELGNPIAAKEYVNGLTGSEVLSYFASDPTPAQEPDPESPVTEVGKDGPDVDMTPSSSPGSA